MKLRACCLHVSIIGSMHWVREPAPFFSPACLAVPSAKQ